MKLNRRTHINTERDMINIDEFKERKKEIDGIDIHRSNQNLNTVNIKSEKIEKNSLKTANGFDIDVIELENLMGIFSKFTFTPLNSLFGLNIYLNVSNNEIPVFNDEQYSNFNEIIDLIDDVLSEMQQLIKEEI